MSRYILHWEVEDGYAGKSRPQETSFDSDDYMEQEDWDELSDGEKETFFEEAVADDFDSRIYFAINETEKLD